MKNILVLGSKGLIGKALSNSLRKNGYKVVDYDKKDGLDINDDHLEETLVQKIKDSDFVYFLAFDVGGAEYLHKNEHTFNFINNNNKMMERVFGHLKNQNKPFVFISSMMTKMPQSTYGILKSIGERYTKALDGISVRFWNVYGPEDIEPGKNHVITDFVVSAIKTGEIHCKTDGSEVRQFIHTDDATNALIMIMKNYDQVKAKIKNELNCIDVSNGRWTSIKEIAQYIKNVTDCKLWFAYEKDKVQRDLKVDGQFNVILNFGWRETIDLETEIQNLVVLYKGNLGLK